jgi:hypothetical protein
MESQPPEPAAPESSPSASAAAATAGPPATPQASPVPTRDPDLVALEGFETEFAELERELEQVERRAAPAGGHAGDGAGTPPA